MSVKREVWERPRFDARPGLTCLDDGGPWAVIMGTRVGAVGRVIRGLIDDLMDRAHRS